MKYQSKYFTVVKVEEPDDNYLITLKIDKSYVVNKEITIPQSTYYIEVIKICEDEISETYTFNTWDKGRLNYWLNDIEKAMMGRRFTALDHIYHIRKYASLFALADRIVTNSVYEDGMYKELVEKIDTYCFENSPYYSSDEDGDYKYKDEMLFHGGVQSIIDHIVDLDMIRVDIGSSRRRILDEDYNRPVLNEYDSSVISEEHHNRSYFLSFAERSLIPQFAVKTNGFNQDFRSVTGKDSYSSVTIKQYNQDRPYQVWINGADDCSYGKEFKTLDEAKGCVQDIKTVSTILLRGHLYKMGFEFTN